MSPLKVTSLPAGHGDCLWVECTGDEGAVTHILIDAGTPGTFKRLKERIEDRFGNGTRHFDLFVITHIDSDHIGGAVKLLEQAGDLGVTFGDIWFNGWDHLQEKAPPDLLGAKQAEAVTETLVKRRLPWNVAFGGKAVVIDGDLPSKNVGGATLTLLSPYREQLHKLIPAWRDELKKAGLLDEHGQPIRPSDALGEPEPPDLLGGPRISVEDLIAERFQSDPAPANGSSIAFVLEFQKQRILFTGDAHPGVLVRSIDRLSPGVPLHIELLKVAHHGSKGNVSAELLGRLACKRYLVSTNGAVFEHPDACAIARVVHFGGPDPQLFFNYDSPFNGGWKSAGLKRKHGYTTEYPKAADEGIAVQL